MFTLGGSFGSRYLDYFPLRFSEGTTPKSSISIATLLQEGGLEWFGFNGEGVSLTSSIVIARATLLRGSVPRDFIGFSALAPALENDIKRGGEDTLDNRGECEHGEERKKERPAHCEVRNLDGRII